MLIAHGANIAALDKDVLTFAYERDHYELASYLDEELEKLSLVQ